MMLDTTALSAMAAAEPNLLKKLDLDPEPMIPAVVLGEYRFGILASRKKSSLLEWLQDVTMDIPVVSVTSETADRYAEICLGLKRGGTPIPTNDIWIAALAVQYGQPVLTLDQHFDHIPELSRVSW